ncbi:hypothetical protein AWB68_00532 [Caballeronia choica]|jgi:uncharacterized protein (TIRG00374 family)|uniref:Integral membrane protein n=2 Tax=Caballeronia choica TaxID=326476 RepID=A0A158FDQ0_9BURK|nr:hypothetical protein AWB68_00532 [Caballeronia choica]
MQPRPTTNGDADQVSQLGDACMEHPDIGFLEIVPALLGKTSLTRSLVLWAVGLTGLLTLVFVVLHFGSLERIVELARSARPTWLLLAIVVQGGTYVSAALVWRQALRRAGHPRSLRTLIPLGIAKVFTDQMLPSGGISGTMLVVSGLIRRRVPAAVAMAAMLAGLVSYDIAYLSVVVAAATMLRLHNRANLPLLIGVTIFAIVMIAIPSIVLGLKRLGDQKPFAWLSRLLGLSALLRALSDAPTDLLRSPRLVMQTVGLQLAIFMFDTVTFWLAFRAIGYGPEPWAIFVSFTMASMAATIGPIPLGLGTFEAAAVGMLHLLGVPIEAALSGTLLLRGLTVWLPMLPGVLLARREIHRP